MPSLGANGAITRASLALDLVEAAEDQGKVVVGGQELTEIMRPQPVVDGDGGHAPARASVGRADQSRPSLALRRWGKCAWSLLLSYHRLDRYRLVALTRLWVLLVHAKKLFVCATP